MEFPHIGISYVHSKKNFKKLLIKYTGIFITTKLLANSSQSVFINGSQPGALLLANGKKNPLPVYREGLSTY